MGKQSFLEYCSSINLDLERDIEPIAKEFLSQKEFEIIAHRLGFHKYDFKTLDELGKKFGRSRENIRQVEDKCIRKIMGKLDWEDKRKNISNILDTPINYSEIERISGQIKNTGEFVRLYHLFRYRMKANTYRDIVEFFEENKLHRNTVLSYHNIRDPIKIRGVGTKSLVVLYKHLHSVGIELFEDGYTSEELGNLSLTH